MHIVKQARSVAEEAGGGRNSLEREEDDRSSEFRQTDERRERERGQCQALTLELREEEEHGGWGGRDVGGAGIHG